VKLTRALNPYIAIEVKLCQPKGVTGMPSTAKPDADCLQSAYESALGDLFEQLFKNLTGLPDGPGDEHYVAMFTTGYNVAKHAKELALGVVGPPAPMIAATVTKKRSVSKRKAR
jgi:hypothetical protein